MDIGLGGVAVGRSIVQDQVPPLHVSELTQPLPEGAEICHIQLRGYRLQHADAPDLRLLGAPRERPRCRAAQKRDELAASHHEEFPTRLLGVYPIRWD